MEDDDKMWCCSWTARDWASELGAQEVRFALLDRQTDRALIDLLQSDPAWRIASCDRNAVVFERTS
jgi:hypothetical protein